MKTLIELRQGKKELVEKMEVILQKADDEKRNLTESETKEYGDFEKSLDSLTVTISRQEKLEGEKRNLGEVKNPLHIPTGVHSEKEEDGKVFRNVGEYFYTIAANPADKRLMELREQTMGTGASGGFAIPEQFQSTLLQMQPQDAIVRPRATVLPAGTPPDAKLTIPSLDQTSAQNIYGGVVVTHTGEGVTMTETSAKLREVTLEPKEITAYIVATDKLLSNWDVASSFITTQLNKARVGQEDYDFLRGDGVNKAVGIINSAAGVQYSRAGASAIAWDDVYGMFARAKFGGSLVWLASQTVIPQLAAMTDAGSHAVWVSGAGVGTGASQSLPQTLMGLPLVFSDRLPALGTKGDLVLADLSYYLIKDGSGPFAAVSTELLFLSNKTVFKIRWNVDAKPWLTEPIPIEGSTTNTISPFVVLN